MMQIIYKILTPAARAQMVQTGTLVPSGADAADGFVHFSSAAQVGATLDRHYSAAKELVLVAVQARGLADLRWEASRDKALFPHLYAQLTEDMVAQEFALNGARDGLEAWLTACDAQGLS